MERDRAIADLVKEKEKIKFEHNKKLRSEKLSWKKQLDEKDKELLELKTTGRSNGGTASERMDSSRDSAISSDVSGLMRGVVDETQGKTARQKEEEMTSRRDSSITNEMGSLMASMGR